MCRIVWRYYSRAEDRQVLDKVLDDYFVLSAVVRDESVFAWWDMTRALFILRKASDCPVATSLCALTISCANNLHVEHFALVRWGVLDWVIPSALCNKWPRQTRNSYIGV